MAINHTPPQQGEREALLDTMRRSIASSFPSCWSGAACPHPVRKTCACLDAAILALDGLEKHLDPIVAKLPSPKSSLSLYLAIALRHINAAASQQPAAHGLPPMEV